MSDEFSAMMPITDDEFARLRDLVYDRYGINLTEKKRTLLVGRLQKVLRREGLASFSDFYDRVVAAANGGMLDELINRISTNFTYFWREHAHYDHLRSVALPEVCTRLQQQRECDLRVWCAAAATGEEPYTLAMLIHEHLGADYSRWQAGLLATDISLEALTTATAGSYSADAVKRLPARLKQRYLQADGDGSFRVAPELRADMFFRRFNLMHEFPFKRPFHIIFCRNVMIYFDRPTRRRLLQKLYHHTAPGGYLYIGHAESLNGIHDGYDSVQPAVYRRPPS